MRVDRETLAWGIILAAFAAFCLSCVGVIFGGRWYLQDANEPQPAILKAAVGTIAIRENGKSEWILATPGSPETTLKEGSSVRTEHGSQAFITLFDQSTITLLPDTEITLATLRLSTYSILAPPKSEVLVTQKTGKTAIGVALSGLSSARFEVSTPHGFLSLFEGSYGVDVNSARSRVRVKEAGRAVVTAHEKAAEATRGQRIDTYSGEPPRPPESSAVEVVTNGSFAEGLSGWKMDNLPGFPEGTDVTGTVQLVQGAGPSAIRFFRTGSKGTHNETFIAQDLDEDVSDITKLQLSIEFRLVKQNVSGGGYMGSEYPLLVRIYYRSDQGEAYVIRGFYYENDANNRIDNGIAVPQNSWIVWTMPENLMTWLPVPRHITRIEIGASGHDYTSEVRRISLSGE